MVSRVNLARKCRHIGDSLNAHEVLECDGGDSVTEIMESDLRDASALYHSLQHIIDAGSGEGATVGHSERIDVIALALVEDLWG